MNYVRFNITRIQEGKITFKILLLIPYYIKVTYPFSYISWCISGKKKKKTVLMFAEGNTFTVKWEKKARIILYYNKMIAGCD